jgi:hypothetical protein
MGVPSAPQPWAVMSRHARTAAISGSLTIVVGTGIAPSVRERQHVSGSPHANEPTHHTSHGCVHLVPHVGRPSKSP